jgi:hypothetical protein
VPLSQTERSTLGEEWALIASELSAERRVFCHRDFHSRNLMVHEGRLYTIDFQDARLGPDTYDLASLLRDSYLDVGDTVRERVLDDFLELRHDTARAEFRRRFDLMSVQRNLKALGTFGYQAAARGKTSYLADVPRTLAYLRGNLRRYPRFSRLHEVLARHLEEVR